MDNPVFGVIISGGKGERLWPLSRKDKPKQLLSFFSANPLLVDTVERILPLVGKKRVLIVTSMDIESSVKKIFPWLREKMILAEPVGRNTAPAICWAAVVISKECREGIMVVLPSDHIIPQKEKFLEKIRLGVELARKGDVLVTIGIQPTRPETGYGYIEVEKEISPNVWRVKRFVEKPEREDAEKFISQGNFFWNSGMFIWRCDVILKKFEELAPTILKGIKEIEKGGDITQIYPSLPDISVDYAIMEKTRNILMIKSDFFWEDTGDWVAVKRMGKKDSFGNVIRGEVMCLSSRNNLIFGREGRLIALLGVEDLVIVDTPDALLIMKEEKAQEVKKLLKEIQKKPEWKKYL